jgi:hypothetical protein
MPIIRQEQYLWLFLSLLLVGVFALGFSDPALRPQVLDFAKIALGGILALLTARAVPPKVG